MASELGVLWPLGYDVRRVWQLIVDAAAGAAGEPSSTAAHYRLSRGTGC